MYVVFLVALMITGYSFQSLFTRLYSASYAGQDAAKAPTVFSVCYGVFVAAASFALGGMSFRPSVPTLLLGLLTAGFLLLYNTSMIEAGNRGSYSFVIVSSMIGGILVPLAVGLLFMGENLNLLQIGAVAMMLLSLYLMNGGNLSFKGASKAYYVWCALLFLANGMYGVLLNLQAQVMSGAERTEMLTIVYVCSALAAALPEIARGKGRELAQGFKMGKKAALYLFICCASATGAANLLLYILTLMESSILYTIDNGGVLVLSILYSFILFKERPETKKIIGMALAVASIVLISLP